MKTKVPLVHTQYGLYTIGGVTRPFCVSFAGYTVPGWVNFYDSTKPWKKWFNNPIFHNRSGYDVFLDRYRVWFIFMWFIFSW